MGMSEILRVDVQSSGWPIIAFVWQLWDSEAVHPASSPLNLHSRISQPKGNVGTTILPLASPRAPNCFALQHLPTDGKCGAHPYFEWTQCPGRLKA